MTWNREIGRLVRLRCGGCHQPGGPAPFSLLDYASARPWAVAIKESVLSRQMPPWPARRGFGEFRDDLSLPQEEIRILAEWADGGAPEGDATFRQTRPAPDKPRAAPPLRQPVMPLKKRLDAPVTVFAVHAVPGTERSWAILPNGALQPLVWPAASGKPAWLQYLTPIRLPSGTAIHGPPLRVKGHH